MHYLVIGHCEFKEPDYIFYQGNYNAAEIEKMAEKDLTEEYINELNSSISQTRDLVSKGEVIIETNQIVEGEKFNKLKSLNYQFSSKSDNKKINQSILIGYFLLVSTLLFLSLIYILF